MWLKNYTDTKGYKQMLSIIDGLDDKHKLADQKVVSFLDNVNMEIFMCGYFHDYDLIWKFSPTQK